MIRKKGTTILLVLILLIGSSLLLYPTVSDRWNAYHQSRMIISHAENVANLSEEECETLLSAAADFNKTLVGNGGRWTLTDEEKQTYKSLLISDSTEIMAYVEIPKIKISLPVYHGTDNSVLQEAIGHLEGSSLPVGGKGTHCVLSGHRGLPSARLFTDLVELSEGDVFMLYTLNEVLTYEVDQIRTVLPTDMSTLEIDPEQDYCTLFTCTPYGVNTHRLMIRGHRIETEKDYTVPVTAEALQIDEVLVALVISVPLLVLIFVITLSIPRKKKTTASMALRREHMT